MQVEKLTIKIIVENCANIGSFLGEAGFSALVDVALDDSSQLRLLFDTGPSPIAFQHNIGILEVDLNTIDAIILSHGHYDHVGGLMEALTLAKKRLPVICHPQALVPKIFKGKTKTINVGIQDFVSADELNQRSELITTTESYRFNQSVLTTGEVLHQNDYEKIIGNLLNITTIQDGNTITDPLTDDLSMIFHFTDDSVIILAGCCHVGIINTIAKAEELTGSNKIVGIIGGLHLHDATHDRLSKTIKSLKRYPINRIAPCHCSGFRGKNAIYNAFPKEFIDAGTSLTITF